MIMGYEIMFSIYLSRPVPIILIIPLQTESL
jgi:hypothetical protein